MARSFRSFSSRAFIASLSLFSAFLKNQSLAPISDEDDPVGIPLKVLNDAYSKVVYKDVLVNSGLYGISHTSYFKKAQLAIDWVALNQKLPEEEIDRLYREYDRYGGGGF